MTWIIILSVSAGIGLGFFINDQVIHNLDQISTIALALLLLGIGIDLGKNRKIWLGLKKMGFKVFLIPTAIALGSIFGAGFCSLFLKMPLNETTAVGAGFGWYSISGILIEKYYNAEIGTVAFLSNVFRELIAVLWMPFLAKHLGFLTPIAAGGATSMDTTLPLISRSTNQETTLIAFISGAVLSTLVPLLVPFLIQL